MTNSTQQRDISNKEALLAWIEERLKKTTAMVDYNVGNSTPFDVLFEECQMLIQEIKTGEVVDRGM